MYKHFQIQWVILWKKLLNYVIKTATFSWVVSSQKFYFRRFSYLLGHWWQWTIGSLTLRWSKRLFQRINWRCNRTKLFVENKNPSIELFALAHLLTMCPTSFGTKKNAAYVNFYSINDYFEMFWITFVFTKWF